MKLRIRGHSLRPSVPKTAFTRIAATGMRMSLPRPRLNPWLRPGGLSVEGAQPAGGRQALRILLDKAEVELRG